MGQGSSGSAVGPLEIFKSKPLRSQFRCSSGSCLCGRSSAAAEKNTRTHQFSILSLMLRENELPRFQDIPRHTKTTCVPQRFTVARSRWVGLVAFRWVAGGDPQIAAGDVRRLPLHSFAELGFRKVMLSESVAMAAWASHSSGFSVKGPK